MDGADVSDLEEGEILEYDSVPSNGSRGDFGVGNWSLEPSLKGNKNGHSGLKENKRLYLSDRGKDGYINKRLKEKLNLSEKLREKSNISMADLESISSEGEYKSDKGENYSDGDNNYCTLSNAEMKKRKKQSSHFYGAVEDIMSEIGETICRKSQCNYKRRKSKELKQNLEKCSNSSYDQWRREIFSSHLKSKKRKRKGSFCDSDSDVGKYRAEKRRKRKKREASYEEEETAGKKLKLRDFDEVRKNLLEKLKKQKTEEEVKESMTPPELESSEIQEIDMLIDCTNYVDNPPDVVPDPGNEGREPEEKEGEDELDLVKLRLIALASNKKRKVVEEKTDAEKFEDFEVAGEKSPCREEAELDRNELLLRAEALKTALLKKHQRRLNKLKMGKETEVGGTSVNEEGNSLSHTVEGSFKCTHLERENEKLDADACKENIERGSETETGISSNANAPTPSHDELEANKGSSTALAPNANSKKTLPRVKTKRKKRKSLSLANSLKENNEKSETLEEDDSTLRTQLLSDLMRKKSLKDLEKKSVLLDSIQTAANKPSPSTVQREPPKDNAKPVPVVKKNSLKKINTQKAIKPAVVPKFPKADIQRIIVHLGSEDSSDEEAPAGASAAPQEEIEKKRSPIKESPDASKQAADVIQAKYERSVEQLLSQARRKVEGEKRVAASTLATPEAVYKHLPPSQRLEYIRLKQKIAERERLKKQKNESNSTLALSDLQAAAKKEASSGSVSRKPQLGNVAKAYTKSLNSSSDSSSCYKNVFKAGVVRNAKSVGGIARASGAEARRLVIDKAENGATGLHSGAPAPENSLKNVPPAGRNFLLLPSSQALLSKLKLLLRKIKVEKTIEENYEKEISKLKNQLGLFEKRKCEQRFKIKKLWEESMKTYKAIQGITARAKGKAEPKESEGEKKKEAEVSGRPAADEGKKTEKEEEEVTKVDQEEGKKVSDETETEITESKSDKELDSDDKISDNLAEAPSCPMKYESPLQAFAKVSDCSARVDPNVMVCQFDLMGVCKDEECAYQHLSILAK